MTTRIDWSAPRALFDTLQFDIPAPLEQSWNYGEAINAASFNDVRRGVVEIDGEPIAALQTVERKLPIALNLVRLTRGPVSAQAGLLDAFAKSLRSNYPRWSRNILFWMPDVADADGPMRSIGKRPMTSGYTTAWLDLSPPEEELRRRLRGNWRNALSRAENNDMMIRVSWRMEEVEPFIAHYVRDRKAQKYSGPSANFVRLLADRFGRDVILIRALDHGDAIAASLFLRHGTSATYYLSWTTELGREKNAAHLILWEGVTRLKKDGVRWLDLGGMDARAPGLARLSSVLGRPPLPIREHGSDVLGAIRISPARLGLS